MKRYSWARRARLLPALLLLAIVTRPANSEPPIDELLQKGDYQAAATAIANTPPSPREGYSAWKALFRQKDQLRVLLDALLLSNPNDSESRLERLDLSPEPLDAGSIADLEELLKPDAPWAFARGKGTPRSEVRFRGYYDLAYRLMRLYERQSDRDKMAALALRIAKGDKPFRDWWRFPPTGQYDERDDLAACLAVAIHNEDLSALAELEKSLPDAPWLAARAQIARRTGNGWPQQIRPAVGWANLPDGASAWVCNDAVQSLAFDDKYIYAGMPWGIAVYSRAGEPVTRVALAAAATQIVVQNSSLWVATPECLVRVERDTWSVASLAVAPTALFLKDSTLWIGTSTGIQRYDTVTSNVTAYPALAYANRFLDDGTRLWCLADYSTGSAYYDGKADNWVALAYQGKPVDRLVVAGGVLWGLAKVDEKLGYRPCIIDRDTLAITPVLIDETEEYANLYGRDNDDSFPYRGQWEGKPVFGQYYYDPIKHVLRGKSDFANLEEVNAPLHQIADMYRSECDGLWRSFRASAVMPNGNRLCALCPQYASGHQYPVSEIPTDHDVATHDGGLFLVPPGKPPIRISSFVAADSLPGDIVTGLAFGSEGRHWACTTRGVAVFDPKSGVIAHFTKADGLCANRVAAVVPMGGRTYFATGCGNDEGGLSVYDEQTRVFTPRLRADGLASNRLVGAERQGDSVRLVYGIERVGFGDAKYQRHPPGLYDAQKGTVAAGGSPEEVPRPEVHPLEGKRMPFLGGFILTEQKCGDRTYLCGTRGLVMFDGAAASRDTLVTSTIEPHVVLTSTETQQKQARDQAIVVRSPSDLERYLADPNPYVRAKALNAIPRTPPPATAPRPARPKQPVCITEAFEPAILKGLADPDDQVRETALSQLLQSPDSITGTQALKERLADPDLEIRGVAATELARRGEKLDDKVLRWLLELPDYSFELCRHCEQSYGINAFRGDLLRNLAPRADLGVFKLLLEFPPRSEDDFDGSFRTTLYPALGAALRSRLDAVDVFLHAPPAQPGTTLPEEFTRHVFACAGKQVLPKLSEGIASDDPSVRANAMVACGAVQDPGALDCLEKGWGFKDRKSRQALAEALAASNQPKAPAMLAKLFVQCSKDSEPLRKKLEEKRGLFEINNPAGPKGEAAELLRQRMETVLPDDFTSFLYRAWPGKQQEFLRLLAVEDELPARMFAARELGDAKKDDIAKAIPVLRTLLGDPDCGFRPNRSLIPQETDHAVRRKRISDSDAKRSGVPGHCVRLNQSERSDAGGSTVLFLYGLVQAVFLLSHGVSF